MKITALVENKKVSQEFYAQHGLSLYIETSTHKILFDMGQDDAFIKNAKIKGIDLSLVDIAVISHGHDDHGGGLDAFLQINQMAKVYLSSHAFDAHLKRIDEQNIAVGLEKPEDMSRINMIDEDMMLDAQIMLMTDVPFQGTVIIDEDLFYQRGTSMLRETFDHEIYMIIKEHHKHILFTGCSHKGIKNIVDRIKEKFNITLDTVIGGFHFSHYDKRRKEENSYLQEVGEEFASAPTKQYYACHCTGDEAFDVLKKYMGEKLHPLSTGEEITID